jgi:hypothetical protein
MTEKKERKAEKKDTKPLRIVVSAQLRAYLTILSKKTLIGASENDVASYLLTQRLEAMLKEKYHEKNEVPKEAG